MRSTFHPCEFRYVKETYRRVEGMRKRGKGRTRAQEDDALRRRCFGRTDLYS